MDEANPPAQPPVNDPPAGRTRRRRRRERAGGSVAAGSGATASANATTKAGSGEQPTPVAKANRRRKPAAVSPRGPKLPTTKEISAGGVVYRRTATGVEVILASRRTRRGNLAWGLAKGGIEDGETREQAAIREVREETGLTAEIEADLGDTKYMYVWEDVRIRKTVHFFLMKHTGGDEGDRDDEMEEIRWFALERAMKRAAYRGEREILARAASLLR